MGDSAQQQQEPKQVMYDPTRGQYYTNNKINMVEGMFGLFDMMHPEMGISQKLNITSPRNYLNNFGQSSPSMQQQAPYQYANTSLESLFPMLQGGQMNQGGALDGLLANVAQGATGQASSGAGRFM
jgi:hypothetical protein